MKKTATCLISAWIAMYLPCVDAGATGETPSGPNAIFDRGNLVAWCIVPFDAKKRGPEARAEMLSRMGIFKFAYDWRAEHIPTFDEELDTLQRWKIELTAFWFPGDLNDDAKTILDVLKRHGARAELWVTRDAGPIECSPEEHKQRVAANVNALRPIVEAAAAIGCKVGLYNHGGWFGEPENQIELINALGAPNVGIVYNLHHGHSQVDRLPQLMKAMMPYLYCVNLNGMTKNGDKNGKLILPIGTGELDLQLVRTIRDSGYKGPVGILGHTMDDAEETLLDNLDGLEWLVPQLDGAPPKGPRPPLRVGAQHARVEIEDPARRAALPEFQVIPPADFASLTPAQQLPIHYYAEWSRSHGGNHNARYSPCTQITKANAGRLKQAWIYRSGDGPANIQCNPIVVNGVMYAPTSGQHIAAIDATSGNERWRFKPGAQPAFRGLLYWRGSGDLGPRLFFNAGDSLWALDPETGRPSADFGDHGRVVTGEVRVAPAVFQNVIVLAGFARDVSGYDVASGKHLWTFHTIPHDGEFARDTWTDPEEGANCWGGIALDDQRGIVYVSTGSPKPNFAGNTHTGQNLFANCVIALDALTGKYRWHFQELRHDIWDLDIPAPPILVSFDWQGRKVDAVAQFTKLGNTLVLDRVTGENLFPVRLRRAPVSTVPGERTWPYQPDIELPQPFSRQQFTLDDVTDRTESARAHVLKQLDGAAYGWFQPMIENKPVALYGFHGGAEWTGGCFDPNTGRVYVSSNHVPWIVTLFRPDDVVRDPNAPPTLGQQIYQANCMRCHGADRYGVGTNPPLQGLGRRAKEDDVRRQIRNGKNLMPSFPSLTDDEVNAVIDFLLLRDVPDSAKRPASTGGVPRFTHNGYPRLSDDEGYPGCKPPYGTLNCIDLASGGIVWQVPLGTYPELEFWSGENTGAENFGGPSITATGVLFCAGAADLKIRAFDADNGAVLWEHPLPYGGYAPPTIYEANGTEYVVIPATGGGKLGTEPGDAYVAFAL